MMTTILDFDPQAVIIDAGSFPENPIARSWLTYCSHIICCDGAANEYLSRGLPVWRIVGDCDSLSEEIRDRYADIIRRFPDQETNDQTKAVRYLAGKGMHRVVILGATGRREDHTLSNISLLIDYLLHGVEARIYTDYGVFIPVEDECEFSVPRGTQVSIFNFGASGMMGDGLRYPLRDFDSWWQGTLNETVGEVFRIRASGFFLLFINYPE